MKTPAIASACIALLAVCSASLAAGGSLPAPWRHQDIGAVAVAGDARIASDVFSVSGTLDIWGTSDGCHFVWQTLKGDGAIIARVLSIEVTHYHAKAGVTMRESLSAGTPHVTWVNTPADGTQFLMREQSGGATKSKKNEEKAAVPLWLKLVREGDTFTGFQSTDGKAWIQVDSCTVKLAETLHIGLVASSHQKEKRSTATFDRVAVIRSPP